MHSAGTDPDPHRRLGKNGVGTMGLRFSALTWIEMLKQSYDWNSFQSALYICFERISPKIMRISILSRSKSH